MSDQDASRSSGGHDDRTGGSPLGDPTGATERPGGERIFAGRYRLVARRGRATDIAMFEAFDALTDRPVAVKIIHPDICALPGFEQRFVAAMHDTVRARHPNLTEVYDVGSSTWGGRAVSYAVCENLTGGSVRDLRDRGRQLSPSQVVMVGLDACRGLDAAHRVGMVHGDIRPANLVFGGDGRLRLADLGLARLVTESMWADPAGVDIERAKYASPEQAQGNPSSAKSDVYSLCLCLLEAVTGQLPFVGDSAVATLANRIDRLMPASADLGALAAVFERAGRPDPDDRSTAAEFGRALLQAAERLPRPTPIALLGGATSAAAPLPPEASEPPDAPASEGPATEELASDDLAGPAAEDVVPEDLAAEGPAAEDVVLEDAVPEDLTADGLTRDEVARDDLLPEDLAPHDVRPDDLADVHPASQPSPADAGSAEPRPAAILAMPIIGPRSTPTDATGAPGAARAVADADGTEAGPAATVAVVPPPPVPESPPPLLRERRSRRTLFGVVAVLLLALAVGGALAVWFARDTTHVVPDLVGLEQGEALNTISTFDWIETIVPEASDDIAAGAVIRTDPAAGARLDVDDPITIVVSTGPAPRILPDLTGLTVDAATAALAELDLALEVGEQPFRDDVPVGQIVSWTVPDQPGLVAGDTVLPDTTVVVVVSAGPAPRSVPDLTGLPAVDAGASLEGLGLVVALLPEEFSPTVPAGGVARQDPPAGTEVPPGTTVSIAVSKGPDLVVVPPLSDLGVEQARAALEAAGLVLGQVKGDPAGVNVLAEVGGVSIGASTSLPRGTAVDLTFAVPPPPTTVAVDAAAPTG